MADMHIGYLIKQVFLMNQARLNTIFAEFDLTASQTFTLIYLFKAHERGEQVHQKDIEDAMDISNPSVSDRGKHCNSCQHHQCKENPKAFYYLFNHFIP